MKISLFPALVLLLGTCAFVCGAPAFAQDAGGVGDEELPAGYVESDDAYVLDYGDYTVKGYALSFGGGSFSGATFLDLQPIGPRTTYPINTGEELGPGDILGYNGLPLEQSRARDSENLPLFDEARKEIRSGPAFGGRVGIYVAEHFHLDVVGVYAQGEAVTSMVYRGETNDALQNGRRYTGAELDPAAIDEGFSILKGGVGLMYDAENAKIFGITPRLGFGLGGIINSFSQLEDKTALYLEGTLGLDYEVARNVNVFAQADITTFAFEVDELGYSNMVNYKTFSLGLTWFTSVLPAGVREAHLAGQ